MQNPLASSIAAIIRAELQFNLKRVATPVLFVLFCLNALLWWGGASVHYGWASNGDFYIVRLFCGFSFLTAPFFVALMMGDAVARDFRFDIHPLLFSSPISRAEYLLGKFFGNFLTLVGCFAGFAVSLFLLQWTSRQGMIVLPWRAFPYFKHFVMFVVVSNLLTATICFAVGAITRNAKLVYGLVVICYVVYVAIFATLAGVSPRLAAMFDPFLFDWVNKFGRSVKPELLNQLAIDYDVALLTNRGLMLGLAATCLTILCFRFSTEARLSHPSSTTLSLNDPAEFLNSTSELSGNVVTALIAEPAVSIPIPPAAAASQNFRANGCQFLAMVATEFRLLRSERSLIVIVPLLLLSCALELGPAGAAPNAVAYATNSAQTLLLLLFGITLFYTGEMMHRDRELRIEPLLWSAPLPDWVLLLSKFAAMALLVSALMAMAAATAILLHLFRDPASVELLPYVPIYSIILLPGALFMIGATIALHAVLHEKYLAHAVALGLGGGLIYLLMQGKVNPLYNPTLHGLWRYVDLTGSNPFRNGILLQRWYWLAITLALLAIAHGFFQREPAGTRIHPLTIALLATTIATILGVNLHR